ncbi:MAG: M57 family metalloprotease [Candidatus Cyclobacteriaceae bacterium M2_1C_046]
MKTLKTSLIAAGAVILSTFFITSCNEEEIQPDQLQISPEVIAQFESLGFDVSDIEKKHNHNPITGETDGFHYILEKDIAITPETLEGMLSSDLFHEGPVGEQYRTYNLVSTPRTVRVLGYTGGSNALDSKMRTALQWSVDNYNRINTNLSFTLSFGTGTSNADIVVYRVSGGAGGSAGFPEGGRPYKWVQIYSGTSNYDTNVVEHVITHEMGHCLGMRHSDYFNRSLSCGSGGNEGSSGVGAVHVPGTPSGYDSNSLMNACFSSSEDGEFGYYDVRALEYLY